MWLLIVFVKTLVIPYLSFQHNFEQRGVAMEIQDFVAETITQICQGIQQAKLRTKETGARISPAIDKENCVSLTESQEKVQFIHFDIHVTERQEKQSNGKIKISLATFSLGASGDSSNEEKNIHHVSFDVPIVWPSSEPIKKFHNPNINAITTRPPRTIWE